VEEMVLRKEKPTLHSSRLSDKRTTERVYSTYHEGTEETVKAHVSVDIDLYYVAYMSWEDDKAHWGPPAQSGQQLASRETALEAAQNFAKEKCWFFRLEDKLTYETYKDYLPQPVYDFLWQGQGPEEFQHRVHVTVSVVTQEVVAYRASIQPPDPKANTSVEITEAEAAARVREAIPRLWPKMLEPIEIKIYKLWTRSPYAPPGRPVYMVHVRGRGKVEGRDLHFEYYDGCGVDAYTGEVLYQVIEPPREPEQDVELRVGSEQALEIVKKALPDQLTEVKLEVAGLTSRSRLAPAGTLVYPIRITAKAAAPDKPEELWEWAQTWAVDAATDRIYGLHASGEEDQEVITPLWPSFSGE